MTIETIEIGGFKGALRGMRFPLKSGAKADTNYTYDPEQPMGYKVDVGPNDKDLSMRLQAAGPEHCKHLRHIFVQAEICADRAWWLQFDTYRYGVERISESTMHTLMRRPLEKDDFEHDCVNDDYMNFMLDSINTSIEAWRWEKDEEYKKQIWRSVIEALPQSYKQKRIVTMSYAALRNIVKQRKGHKLIEWEQFIDWCRTLPESWMIFE